MKKIFITLFIFILIFAICPQKSNALSDIINSGDNFSKIGVADNNVLNMQGIKTVSDDIYTVLLSVAVVAAVVIAAMLGIQFMVGSVEAKAKVKDSLMPFVIGCVIVFGSFGIWKIIVDIWNKVVG